MPIQNSRQFSLILTSLKAEAKTKITHKPCNGHRLSMAANHSSSDSRQQLTVAPPLQISQDVCLRVKKLPGKAVLPLRGSPLAAGYDLSCATEAKVPARGKAFVPTDLSIAIPDGILGLAWKHSIDVGAGVVDADYRGQVVVVLFYDSDVDFGVKVGDRIAQLTIEKIMTPDALDVEDLDSTVIGAGFFFGSTGV